MNRTELFKYLEKEENSELLALLQRCYDHMSTQQLRDVFGHLENNYIEQIVVDGKILLKAVKQFKIDSLNGVYYAPFDIN